MGFQIEPSRKYPDDMLTVVIRNDPGGLKFVIVTRLAEGITNIDDFENDMIKHKLPIRKGGCG